MLINSLRDPFALHKDAGGNVTDGALRFLPKAPQPLVTFCFDDCYETDLTVMKPVFDAQGEVACSCIVTDLLDTASHLTSANVQTLAAAGWEIVNHGKAHADLTGLTEAQMRVEISGGKTALQALGLSVPSYAYPFSASNELVRRVMRDYHRVARGHTVPGLNAMVLDTYRLHCYPADDHTLLATYQGYVDDAVADDRWLIFVIHSTDADDATAMGTLIDYIQAAGVSIVTLEQGLALAGNVIDVGENFAIGERGFGNVYGKQGRFVSTAYPAVDILRDTGATGTSMYAGAKLERLVPRGVGSDRSGIAFYFKSPNDAGDSTFGGMFGGGLHEVADGAEKGFLIFNPAWQGADPSTRYGLRLIATGSGIYDNLVVINVAPTCEREDSVFQIEDDVSNAHIFRIHSKHAAVDDLAGVSFGVHTASANRVSKSAIVHQRKGSWGQGEMVFLVDANTDEADVAIGDEVMRLKSTGAFVLGLLDISGAIVAGSDISTDYDVSCGTVTPANGWSGSWVNNESETVTVLDGIITGVA